MPRPIFRTFLACVVKGEFGAGERKTRASLLAMKREWPVPVRTHLAGAVPARAALLFFHGLTPGQNDEPPIVRDADPADRVARKVLLRPDEATVVEEGARDLGCPVSLLDGGRLDAPSPIRRSRDGKARKQTHRLRPRAFPFGASNDRQAHLRHPRVRVWLAW